MEISPCCCCGRERRAILLNCLNLLPVQRGKGRSLLLEIIQSDNARACVLQKRIEGDDDDEGGILSAENRPPEEEYTYGCMRERVSEIESGQTGKILSAKKWGLTCDWR